MEIIEIGLLFKDRDFCKVFSRALSRASRMMKFYIIDDLNDCKTFGFVITDLDYIDCEIPIYLDEAMVNEASFTAPYRLFKYMDSSQIIKSIIFIVFQATGKVIDYNEDRNSKIVTVCQLKGGQGCTATSISITHFLNFLYDKKCLYINLDIVNNSLEYLKAEQLIPPLKLAYYLEEFKELPVELFIESFKSVSFLNSGIRNIGINVSTLISRLETYGQFDILILDIGNSWTKRNLDAVSNSDCLVIIDDDKNHEDMFYRNEALNYIKNLKKDISKVMVKNFAMSDSINGDWEVISLDDEAFSVEEGLIKMNFNRNYGTEIQFISNKVMEAIYEEQH